MEYFNDALEDIVGPVPRSWDDERHGWSLSHTTVGTLDYCCVNLSLPDSPVLRCGALHVSFYVTHDSSAPDKARPDIDLSFPQIFPNFLILRDSNGLGHVSTR